MVSEIPKYMFSRHDHDTYTDITEKNRHQHKYFPINMCLFMFTGENSSGIT